MPMTTTPEALAQEIERLDRIAEATHNAWRSADVLRDPRGGRLALRRSGSFLEIETPAEGVRLGPATLRAVARVMLLAAADIERGDA